MKQPENTSKPEMFDPKKMEAIVERLKREGRLPSLEQLNEVLLKYRKQYQEKVREIRNRG